MRKLIYTVILFTLVNIASAQDVVNSWSGKYKNENGVLLTIEGPAENGAISFTFTYGSGGCALYEEGIAYIIRPGFAKCEEVTVNITMVNGKIIVDEYRPYSSGIQCPPLKGNYIKSVRLTGEEILKKYTYYFNESDPKKYFNIFLEKEIPNYILVSMHQPTLNDCFKIFKPEAATIFYVALSERYREFLFPYLEEDFTADFYENEYSKYSTFQIEQFNSNDLISENCDECPGWMSDITDFILPDLELYTIRLDDSYRFTFFCYVNNRWVLVTD